MNTKIFNSLVLAICGILFCIILADINGKWSGIVNYNGSKIPVSFSFKSDNGTLTGTSETPLGSTEIREGKVDKGIINFKTDLNGQPAIYTGRTFADSINLKISYQGGEYITTLRRSNSQ